MDLNRLTPMIVESLEDLSENGIGNLIPTLERLMNELMKIEREQVLQAAPYERTERWCIIWYVNSEFKKILE